MVQSQDCSKGKGALPHKRVKVHEHLHKERCYSMFFLLSSVFGLVGISSYKQGFIFCAHLRMKGKGIPYLKALVISMPRTLLSALPLHNSLAHPAYGLGQRVPEAQSPYVQPLVMLSVKHLWNHDLKAKVFCVLGEY